MAIPTSIDLVVEFQDTKGFRALTRIVLFDKDASDTVTSPLYSNVTLSSFLAMLTENSPSIFGALAAMSNAKAVRQSISFSFNIAQEPTTESGTYQLVQDKAKLEFGDGSGGFASLSIPAPKDALFLSPTPVTQDNLIVVNPASSLLTTFQTALHTGTSQGALSAATTPALDNTPRGGVYAAQFFGGEYEGRRSRRRRVLQGQ